MVPEASVGEKLKAHSEIACESNGKNHNLVQPFVDSAYEISEIFRFPPAEAPLLKGMRQNAKTPWLFSEFLSSAAVNISALNRELFLLPVCAP